MRKIITIAILFFSFVSFSQIKVVETIPVEKLGRIENSVYVQKQADEYTFFYNSIANNETAATYRNFSFKNINNDFESLYEIIMGGFAATPLYDIKLELPNDFVWLQYIKGSDKTTVQFMVSNKVTSTTGISEPLTNEQIKKLFEKV